MVIIIYNGSVDFSTIVESKLHGYCGLQGNHYQHQTPRGADASAVLYSLVQTAKANNLEPFAFLTHILTELPKLGRHYDDEALDQFMPWNLTEKIQPLNKVA